jgi:TolA-binding protein
MCKAYKIILKFAIPWLLLVNLIFYTGYADFALISYSEVQSKEEEMLFMAKKAFEDGYYEVSLGLLERFLSTYPGSPKVNEADLLVGECYFYQNKFQDALGRFEALLKKPFSERIKDAILYWIAEVYFKSNDFSRAAVFYKDLINQFPNSSYTPLAYYSLGWCSFQENKFEEAKGYFKIIEDRYPKEPQARDASFKIIECLYNLRDYSSLRDKVKSVIKLFSGDAARVSYLYFYLAESEYYLENFNQAVEFYNKALKDKSGDIKMYLFSHLGLGWTYLKLKKYKEAEAEFIAILDGNLDKKSVDVLLLGKAVLFLETGRQDEAVKIYSKLIDTATDPLSLAQAYLGKADILLGLKEYGKSVLLYREALNKIKSESVTLEIIDRLHYNLGVSLLKQGEIKEAVKEFQGLAIKADNIIAKAGALLAIGDLYQDSGDLSKAEEVYRTILKEYPDSDYQSYIQYQLGSVYLKKENYDLAIKELSGISLGICEPKLFNSSRYSLALAYFKKQDYTNCIKVLEEMLKTKKAESYNLQAVYLLGSCYYNLNDFNKAISYFKEIINRSPDEELIQKALYGTADSFYQIGNEKEALIRFNALRLRYSGSDLTAQALFWLGNYYYRNNDFNLANRYFLSLIQDFPKSYLIFDAYYYLELISAQGLQTKEVVDNFNKVMESEKPQLKGMAAVSAGDLFYRLEDYARAIEFYRKGIVFVGQDEANTMRMKIAECLEADGDIDGAIAEYLKLSSDLPLNPRAFMRLARIYEDRGKYKEAEKFYKKVLQTDTENSAFAKERIDWIELNIKN